MKWYPRDRVAAVLHRWCEEWRITRPAQGGEYGVADHNSQMGAIEWLVEQSGVPNRTIYRIMNGPSQYEITRDRSKYKKNKAPAEDSTLGTRVAYENVDKLFCVMGLTHLYHAAPEEGGFADLYDPHYGLPEWYRAILEELQEHDDDLNTNVTQLVQPAQEIRPLKRAA